MPQLTWLGDADAKRAARRVPYRMLDPVEQADDPAAQNWLIQGDNLDALKALFVAYALLTALILALVRLRVVDLARAGSISLQIVGLVVGLVILAFSIAAFVRRPDGTRPDFAQSGVVAAIMQVASLLIALAISALGMPLNGRP